MKNFLKHLLHVFVVVALSLVVLSFWPTVIYQGSLYWKGWSSWWSASSFFHLFHFAHVVFSSMGSFLVLYRDFNNLWLAVMISATFPVMICTLSDVLLPYLGGVILGVPMSLHLCIVCNFSILAGCIFAGVFLGFVISFLQNKGLFFKKINFSVHLLHGFVSGLASLVYLASFGFFAWQESLPSVFFLLLIAVALPCAISDILVPLFIGNFFDNKIKALFCCNEKN